jgi:hypothetical protein
MEMIEAISKMKLAAVLAILLTGCCAQPHPPAPPASPTTSPASADPPSMVHEAQLPQGFPPPGPIGQVIVKNYPACRAATVAASDVNGAGQDDMFRPLFDHIQRENIAMTAPLQMDFEWVNVPAGSTQPSAKPPTAMSFVYRSPRTGKPGKDGIVTVRDLPAVTVISVGVRGSYNAEHFDYGLKAITDWLRIHPNSYRVVGPPRFLGYNSPFVPWFLRYGEVQIPVVPWSSRDPQP